MFALLVTIMIFVILKDVMFGLPMKIGMTKNITIKMKIMTKIMMTKKEMNMYLITVDELVRKFIE